MHKILATRSSTPIDGDIPPSSEAKEAAPTAFPKTPLLLSPNTAPLLEETLATLKARLKLTPTSSTIEAQDLLRFYSEAAEEFTNPLFRMAFTRLMLDLTVVSRKPVTAILTTTLQKMIFDSPDEVFSYGFRLECSRRSASRHTMIVTAHSVIERSHDEVKGSADPSVKTRKGSYATPTDTDATDCFVKVFRTPFDILRPQDYALAPNVHQELDIWKRLSDADPSLVLPFEDLIVYPASPRSVATHFVSPIKLMTVSKRFGEDLSIFINNKKQVGKKYLRQVATFLLRFIQLCEKEGVIYHDAKPQNILWVERPDSSLDLRVIDFGLSTLKADMRRRVSGTIGFMSPQDFAISVSNGSRHELAPELGTLLATFNKKLVASMSQYDTQTDRFSFGVTLFYAATGKLPFAHTPEKWAVDVAHFSENKTLNLPTPTKFARYFLDFAHTLMLTQEPLDNLINNPFLLTPRLE